MSTTKTTFPREGFEDLIARALLRWRAGEISESLVAQAITVAMQREIMVAKEELLETVLAALGPAKKLGTGPLEPEARADG